MTYVEELERQNEELKQKLAEATDRRYALEWTPKNVEDYNKQYKWVYELRIHGLLFSMVLERKRLPYSGVTGEIKRYKCVFKGFTISDNDFDTFEECRQCIIANYNNMFMEEPTL